MIDQIFSITKKNLHIILIFLTLLLATNSYQYYYLDLIFYIFLHVFFIIVSFYDEYNLNYYYVFIIGFVLDLILVNNFGPHLITLMVAYLLIRRLRKFFLNLSPLILIIVNILIIILSLLAEKTLAYLLYDIKTNYISIFQIISFSVFVFYPTYYILNYFKKSK